MFYKTKSNRRKVLSRNPRNVTFDANVVVSALIYDSKICQKALDKVRDKDNFVLTNLIYDQIIRQGFKPKSPLDANEIRLALKDLGVEVIEVDPRELAILETQKGKEYFIRHDPDYVVLLSANETDSVILVTGDKDFYDAPVRGLKKAVIMRPKQYVYETGEWCPNYYQWPE